MIKEFILTILMLCIAVNAQAQLWGGGDPTTPSEPVLVVVDETQEATSSDVSLSYNLINDGILMSYKYFEEGIMPKMSHLLMNFLQVLVGIYFFSIIIKFLISKQIDVKTLLVFFTVVLVVQIAIKGTIGGEFILSKTLKLIIDAQIALAGYLMDASLNILDVKTATGDPLLRTLTIVDEAIAKITEISDLFYAKGDATGRLDFAEKTKLWFLGFIVEVIYFALQFIFMMIFTLGIVAMSFWFTILPIILVLGVPEFLRGLWANWNKLALSLFFYPIFASLAMGMTIFVLTGTVEHVEAYLSTIGDTQNVNVPDGLYARIIMTGLISIIFHLATPMFASALGGGALANFGALATGVAGVGVGVAKSRGGRMAAQGAVAGTKTSGRIVRAGVEAIKNKFVI